MFKSKYCWVVFGFSLLIAYLIVRSNFVYLGQNPFILLDVFAFLILFSLTLTCNVRIIKERIKGIRSKKMYATSLFNVILYVLGFGAIEGCLISSFCGINITLSLLSIILPGAIFHKFIEYSPYVLLGINLLLLGSLFHMKCFKRKKIEIKVKRISKKVKRRKG